MHRLLLYFPEFAKKKPPVKVVFYVNLMRLLFTNLRSSVSQD